uniref:Uncharacterized protein n=1 Tax=Aegilops tauschii subsp. strangulata TaxID=200361 RepID=A0A453CWV7_AEGTS
ATAPRTCPSPGRMATTVPSARLLPPPTLRTRAPARTRPRTSTCRREMIEGQELAASVFYVWLVILPCVVGGARVYAVPTCVCPNKMYRSVVKCTFDVLVICDLSALACFHHKICDFVLIRLVCVQIRCSEMDVNKLDVELDSNAVVRMHAGPLAKEGVAQLIQSPLSTTATGEWGDLNPPVTGG